MHLDIFAFMKTQIIEDCFESKIGDDGLQFQTFNNKVYKLYPKERYFSQSNNRMHVKVYEFHFGKPPKGYHVHHLDDNPQNNRIENLELKLGRIHISEHLKQRIINNPEWFADFQKKGVKESAHWHASEAGIQWHRNHAIKHDFGNQTYGVSNCVVCNTEFTKKTKSQKFCTSPCKQKYRRSLPQNWITKTCVMCNKEFSVYDNEKHKQTCNKSCGAKIRWQSKSH